MSENRGVAIPSGVFTRRMGRAGGLNDHDFRWNPALTRVGSDLYTARGALVTPAAQAVALARTFPVAWVSHESAASLRGIPLEHSPAAPQLTVPAARFGIRRKGVTCHVDRSGGLGVGEIGGIACSTAARIWLEIAPMRRIDAIAFGDQLVRIPRERYEGRSDPFCALPDLVELTATLTQNLSDRRPRGLGMEEWRAVCRRLEFLDDCAGLVRVGADSKPETALRIAMIDAGLPEPVLQYPIYVDGVLVTVADLAYPERKIAIFYDGSPHLTPEAMVRDSRRSNLLSADRWTTLLAVLSDYRQNFRGIVSLLSAELRRAA